MEPFLGQLTLLPAGKSYSHWAPCDGKLLPINQNQTLFSLLGNRFGGDGRTSFALPDLRSEAPEGLAYHIAIRGIFPSGGGA